MLFDKQALLNILTGDAYTNNLINPSRRAIIQAPGAAQRVSDKLYHLGQNYWRIFFTSKNIAVQD